MNININIPQKQEKQAYTQAYLAQQLTRLIDKNNTEFFYVKNEYIYFRSNSNNRFHGFALALVGILLRNLGSYIGHYPSKINNVDYAGYIYVYDTDVEKLCKFFESINSLADIKITLN